MVFGSHDNARLGPAVGGCVAALAMLLAGSEVHAQVKPKASGTAQVKPLLGTLALNLEYRTIDGTGNNIAHPTWGSAGSELLRDTPPDYADGVEAPGGVGRPDPRAISDSVLDQSMLGLIPNSANASDWLWQWGQFVDHDVDLTPGADPDEPIQLNVPAGDPFFDPFNTGTQTLPFSRSKYNPATTSAWRQQVNLITSYIDGSNVYGSDPARAAALRDLTSNGYLKTSAGNLMPFNVDGFPNAMDGSQFFLAGDVRSNEQNGLTATHTLFMREHNRLVGILAPLGLTAEENYQIARLLVGAEIEAITYNEFLPVLLGPNALDPYTGYHADVDASIQNSFSTGTYRVGHTLLSSTLLRLDGHLQTISNGNLPLLNAFFNPQEIINNGIEPLLRGLAKQKAQEIDPFVVDDVRNFLFGAPGAGGMDLGTLNIERGRDHGLGSYNATRVAHGLAARTSFAQISTNPEIVNRLAATYATVDDIDLWVGALSEDHVNGGMVGELLFTSLREQFMALRDGDRFFYKLAMPPLLVLYVDSQKLSSIIRQNTPIRTEVQNNVFIVP